MPNSATDSLLQNAIINNNYEKVNTLIKQGANVNIHCKYFTDIPLYKASLNTDSKMVELLLSQGAYIFKELFGLKNSFTIMEHFYSDNLNNYNKNYIKYLRKENIINEKYLAQYKTYFEDKYNCSLKDEELLSKIDQDKTNCEDFTTLVDNVTNFSIISLWPNVLSLASYNFDIIGEGSDKAHVAATDFECI